MQTRMGRGDTAKTAPWTRGLRTAALAMACATAFALAGGCSSGKMTMGAGGDDLFADPDAGSSNAPAPGGTMVAELALDVPTQPSFVLHGTIPVPKGTYPRPDGLVPFSIRNHDGNVVPTQVELVSSYPDDKDGADVVEVLGRVDLPPGAQVGQRVSYFVVEDPHASTGFPASKALKKFVLTPNTVTLEAEDCFGHVYSLDVLENFRSFKHNKLSKLLRAGQAAVQVRTYGVMLPAPSTPIGAPSGALPHFFGVHAYTTLWAGTDAVSLDLRVHNGFDGKNKSDTRDDPLGKVYFRKLELVMPQNITAMLDVNDAGLGTAYVSGGKLRLPLVKPNANGTLHLMPHQSQFTRRLSLAPASQAAEAISLANDEGQAFVRRRVGPSGADFYSWWNPLTARYYPQRHKLPDLSWYPTQTMVNTLLGNYWMARTALETGNPGNWAIPAAGMGWAHPWGVPYGAMTGGVDINTYDGLELAEVGTNRGWKFSELNHRMMMDRQPTTLYDIEGEPTSVESWLVQGANYAFLDMNFWLKLLNGPDPFGFNKALTHQVQYVAANGLQPAYEGALLAYEPIDFQHHVRLMRTPKVLAWLGNDAIAKDDILHAAQIARLSFNKYPNAAGKSASGSGLLNLQVHANVHPHRGSTWGRGQAWTLDTVVAAYALNGGSFRATVRPWLNEVADVLANTQITCSGFLQANYVPGWLGGQWLIRSQPEEAFTVHAAWGLKETVFRDTDIARFNQTESVIADNAKAMIGPMSWSQYNAPWYLVAVADLNSAVAPYCNTVPAGGQGNGVDNFMNWNAFAYGYEITKDPAFLQKAAAMAGVPSNLAQGLMNQGLVNMVNKAALLACIQ